MIRPLSECRLIKRKRETPETTTKAKKKEVLDRDVGSFDGLGPSTLNISDLHLLPLLVNVSDSSILVFLCLWAHDRGLFKQSGREALR